MTEKEAEISGTVTQQVSLSDVMTKIPSLVDRDDISKMVRLQTCAIDRLETTNKSVINCTTMAQSKLASTSKLFKKTAKTLNESKKDLDVVYRKIQDLKSRLRADKPELFSTTDNSNEVNDENDD